MGVQKNGCCHCVCPNCAKLHCKKYHIEYVFQRCLNCLIAEEKPIENCEDFEPAMKAALTSIVQPRRRTVDDQLQEILIKINELEKRTESKKKRRRNRRRN